MIKFIPYFALGFVVFFGANLAKGQMVTRLDNFGGHPNVTNQKYIDLKGNPFFYEDWTPAVVYAKNGNQYTDVLLKFDMLNDELQYFVTEKDQAYVLETPVDSFSFVGPEIRNDFVKLADGKFYERLSKGPHNLYKEVYKHIVERRQYSSAEKERIVLTKSSYYVEHNGELSSIRNNRRAILNLFEGAQRSELETFVKENKVNLSNEAGMIQAFNFINNLQE